MSAVCVTMSYVNSRSEEDNMNATITIRLREDEKQLISDYSRVFGMTTSEYVRKTVLEAIEDAIDYKAAAEAVEEFDADPSYLTHDEMMAELGIA